MVRDHALHEGNIGVGIDIAHAGMHLVIGSGISLLRRVIAGGRVCRRCRGTLIRSRLLARGQENYGS
jgi:hypothetical protein